MGDKNTKITDATKGSSYLRLRLDNQYILISLNQIHMIVPIVDLQSIPHEDKALVGILNFHGEAVHVYDLSVLINSLTSQYTVDALFILSELSDGLFGFLVQDTLDIIEVLEENIQVSNMPLGKPYVLGLVELETFTAWVLDFEKLMQFHKDELQMTCKI